MACERTSIIARRLVAAHHQGLHAMGTHHSGRVPGHECPIDEMPPDFWKARRAHEALLKAQCAVLGAGAGAFPDRAERSEEHTSEIQSLMRISYAVFCLNKKTTHR